MSGSRSGLRSIFFLQKIGRSILKKIDLFGHSSAVSFSLSRLPAVYPKVLSVFQFQSSALPERWIEVVGGWDHGTDGRADLCEKEMEKC